MEQVYFFFFLFRKRKIFFFFFDNVHFELTGAPSLPTVLHRVMCSPCRAMYKPRVFVLLPKKPKQNKKTPTTQPKEIFQLSFLRAFIGYSFLIRIFSQTWVAKAKPKTHLGKMKLQGTIMQKMSMDPSSCFSDCRENVLKVYFYSAAVLMNSLPKSLRDDAISIRRPDTSFQLQTAWN